MFSIQNISVVNLFGTPYNNLPCKESAKLEILKLMSNWAKSSLKKEINVSYKALADMKFDLFAYSSFCGQQAMSHFIHDEFIVECSIVLDWKTYHAIFEVYNGSVVIQIDYPFDMKEDNEITEEDVKYIFLQRFSQLVFLEDEYDCNSSNQIINEFSSLLKDLNASETSKKYDMAVNNQAKLLSILINNEDDHQCLSDIQGELESYQSVVNTFQTPSSVVMDFLNGYLNLQDKIIEINWNSTSDLLLFNMQSPSGETYTISHVLLPTVAKDQFKKIMPLIIYMFGDFRIGGMCKKPTAYYDNCIAVVSNKIHQLGLLIEDNLRDSNNDLLNDVNSNFINLQAINIQGQ